MPNPFIDSAEKNKTKYIYHPRLTEPESGNPYYNRPPHGYNTAIIGNIQKGKDSSVRTGYRGLNVLPNCVGYAYGRFNEIAGLHKMAYLSPGNAGDFMAHKGSCQSGKSPRLGACMVWKEDGSYGHVAIVEQINPDGSIVTSESEWNGSAFKKYTRKKGTDGNWTEGCKWQNDRKPKVHFQGFIYNPAVPADASVGDKVVDSGESVTIAGSYAQLQEFLGNLAGAAKTSSQQADEYESVTKTVTMDTVETVNYSRQLNQTKSTNLLTYPTNVETPFILLTVGDYTFGTYTSKGNAAVLKVMYPNFIQGMEVTKINGQLNQYTIRLVYQIQYGDDPNLVDKIFGKVGYGGTVKITYGDWSAPNLIYKEEEALITKLTSNVDFSSAKIIYTLMCTSTALKLMASSYNFEAVQAKPSDIIKKVLFNKTYGLSDVFTGMKSISQVDSKGWIASNDKVVQIQARENIDPLSYINYLVTCMICNSNTEEDVLLNSSYYMTLVDDTYNEQGGPYFTIKQIYSNSKTIHNQNVYEVDIGFPSESMVMSFNIRDDQSWSLLYNYSGSIQNQEYTYNIDNKGRVVTTYSPACSTSSKLFITTPSQKNWWTQVTSFPISATLVIKGLVRPAMLMTYVKVNSFFYGQRHISSGLYFVTKQVDRVDGSGYRTELSLLRFGGDEDYLTNKEYEVTYKQATKVSESTASSSNLDIIPRYVSNSSAGAYDAVGRYDPDSVMRDLNVN